MFKEYRNVMARPIETPQEEGLLGKVFSSLSFLNWRKIGKWLGILAAFAIPISLLVILLKKGSVSGLFGSLPAKIVGGVSQVAQSAWDAMVYSFKYGRVVPPEEAKAIKQSEEVEQQGREAELKQYPNIGDKYDKGADLNDSWIQMVNKAETIIPKEVSIDPRTGKALISVYWNGVVYIVTVNKPATLLRLFGTETDNWAINRQITSYIWNVVKRIRDWTEAARVKYFHSIGPIFSMNPEYWGSRMELQRRAIKHHVKEFQSVSDQEYDLFTFED